MCEYIDKKLSKNSKLTPWVIPPLPPVTPSVFLPFVAGSLLAFRGPVTGLLTPITRFIQRRLGVFVLLVSVGVGVGRGGGGGGEGVGGGGVLQLSTEFSLNDLRVNLGKFKFVDAGNVRQHAVLDDSITLRKFGENHQCKGVVLEFEAGDSAPGPDVVKSAELAFKIAIVSEPPLKELSEIEKGSDGPLLLILVLRMVKHLLGSIKHCFFVVKLLCDDVGDRRCQADVTFYLLDT